MPKCEMAAAIACDEREINHVSPRTAILIIGGASVILWSGIAAAISYIF
jgi:hypothetical protein